MIIKPTRLVSSSDINVIEQKSIANCQITLLSILPDVFPGITHLVMFGGKNGDIIDALLFDDLDKAKICFDCSKTELVSNSDSLRMR